MSHYLDTITSSTRVDCLVTVQITKVQSIIIVYIIQHWSDVGHSLDIHWGLLSSLNIHWLRTDLSVSGFWVRTRVCFPPTVVGGKNFIVRYHEGPGVEVGVGDVVHLVHLGAVLYLNIVVAGVGRKSEDIIQNIEYIECVVVTTDLFAMSWLDFVICWDLGLCRGLALERGVGTILALSMDEEGEERPESELEDFTW